MEETESTGPDRPAPGDEPQDTSRDIAVTGDILPVTLHLLPLFERPYFPIQAMPLVISEEPWLETVAEIGESPHRTVGLVMVKPDADDPPDSRSFHRVGSVVRMHNPVRKEGKIQFIAEGVQRFRIAKWISREPPYQAQVEYLDDVTEEDPKSIKAYALALINVLKELIALNPLYSEEFKLYLERFTPNQPAFLVYFAASLTSAPGDELQEILEQSSLLQRMEAVLILIKKELEVAKIQSEIRQEVDEKMGEQQRKFFLREQLKVIQKELGISKDDRTAEVERFAERLKSLTLPETAQARVDEEMDKLAVLEQGSPEYAVTRNYLDWITSLPWGKTSKDVLDLKRARRILDRDHTGLDDIKQRILEFLAVGKLRGGIAGTTILLFVGPPGVGKTSIGRSIAEALGRRFFRLSVGGMRDEAEIKGHRRTYIGAMPGKFIQALKEVDVANPVIMLDEVDKIGASYQGDPASALLEVLDPEQNTDFLDHYLDLRFDLSRVLFICTANQLDTIPAPLLDRMEVIRLSGYIAAEKVQIAREHLWPRQLERTGLKGSQVKVTDAALRRVVDGYAREAGVRGLEKQLGRLARKAAVDIVESRARRVRVGTRNLEDYLGKPLFTREKPLAGVGIVTGLAWTAMGGATLNIEATRVHRRNRGLKLTGNLGGVMRESAEIAYSYVTSHLEDFEGDAAYFEDRFIHLHVPAGATPKDGPSAGVTMATALVSLARGKRPLRNMAMTGELTLTGQVFPVGGIREKVIAARRVGINTLVLPEKNRRDFEELPDYLRDGIRVHYAERFKDVFEVVFGK